MTKIEPWTQEQLEERRQSEPTSSWYGLTLKIGVAVLLAGGLVALVLPTPALRHGRLEVLQAELR
jgi:hypothetical protein